MNKHNEPFFALHSALTRIFILKNTLSGLLTRPQLETGSQSIWHLALSRMEHTMVFGTVSPFQSYPTTFQWRQHFQTSDDLHVS